MTGRFSALMLQRFNGYCASNELHRDDRIGSARAAQDTIQNVLRFAG